MMKSKTDISKVEKISTALGDPYRVEILNTIAREKDGVSCNTIVEMYDLAQSTVSHHLKQLVDADLLLLEKDGRHSRYWVNRATVNDYISLLKKI